MPEANATTLAATMRDLDHPAVKLYRDICHITPNHVQRREIIATVSPEGELGIVMWKGVLEKFMLEGNNPKRVDWTLDRYEQRLRGPKL